MPTPTLPQKYRLTALITIGLTLTLLATPGSAAAKPKRHPPATHNETTPKKGVKKVTYQRSPSEETRAERDRRMHRECKGMHNAGACLGYTR